MSDEVNAPVATEFGTPWYKQAAFYISLLSLLVSALAVILSTRHTAQEDLTKRRTELTGYVQRIAALNSKGGSVSDEQAALVKVAAELALKTPEIPAIFYRQIAEGFRQVYAEDNAAQFSDLALARAQATKDLIEEVEIHRFTMASIDLDNGDIAGMRKEYEAALEVTKQYRGNKVTLLYDVPGYTEILWGTDEANLGNCAEAKRHLQEAKRYVESRPLRSGTLDDGVANLEEAVSTCQTGS
jgi:hypothetical protein